MRLEGSIRKWNEDRGFGFIKPFRGGADVFVHISAFQRGAAPRVGEYVSYETTTDTNGKTRAVYVLRAGETGKRPRTGSRSGSASSRPIRAIADVIAVVLIGAVLYLGYQHREKISDLLPIVKAEPAPGVGAEQRASRLQQYVCDGRKYCSQMTSCDEAKYFLEHCPSVQMDGNHDGEPCEAQWCQ